jgi:hypothetical protein
VALKCNTKSEFYTKFPGAYENSHKNGWINEICSHMVNIPNKKDRLIYAYEFSDNHIYIGLTYNIKIRQISRNGNQNDQVTKYIKQSGLIPIRKILFENISYLDSGQLEIDTIKNYKLNGWIILNKNKGGGIGGKFNIKWTEESLLKEVSKYISKLDWYKNNRSSYDTAKYKFGANLFNKCLELIKTNNIEIIL